MSATGNTPEEASPVLPAYPTPRHKAGYVERLKIQRTRLKNLNVTEDTSATVNKLLPKIKKSELDRVNTSALSRSGTLESIKLPSVISFSDKSSVRLPTKLKRKDDVFVKSLLNTYPEHVTLLAKSLPSLPSIPGSPGDDLNSVLEDDESIIFNEPPPTFTSKNKYQKIAFRKHLEHRTSPTNNEDSQTHKTERYEPIYVKNVRISRNTAVPPIDRENSLLSVLSVPVRKDCPQDTSVNKQSLPARYRKKDRNTEKQRRFRSLDARSDAMSVKSDSVLNSVKPKWKEDCECLRCKMMKRKFKDGDDSYKMWGQYPCQCASQDDDP